MDRKYGKITATRKNFPEEEPLFLLRAQDKLAPVAVRLYGAALKSASFFQKEIKGFDSTASKLLELADECERQAKDMELWQLENKSKVKLPD